jgi:hypothetical protein
MRRQLGFANELPHPLKALDKKFELPHKNLLRDLITICTHLCLDAKE